MAAILWSVHNYPRVGVSVYKCKDVWVGGGRGPLHWCEGVTNAGSNFIEGLRNGSILTCSAVWTGNGTLGGSSLCKWQTQHSTFSICHLPFAIHHSIRHFLTSPSFLLLAGSEGFQRFSEQPKYTEVNPAEDTLLTCKVIDKRGTCSWQKDNKVIISAHRAHLSMAPVYKHFD